MDLKVFLIQFIRHDEFKAENNVRDILEISSHSSELIPLKEWLAKRK